MRGWSCCYCRKLLGQCVDHNVTKNHLRNQQHLLQCPDEIQKSKIWVETHGVGVTKDNALRHIGDLFAIALGYGMASAEKGSSKVNLREFPAAASDWTEKLKSSSVAWSDCPNETTLFSHVHACSSNSVQTADISCGRCVRGVDISLGIRSHFQSASVPVKQVLPQVKPFRYKPRPPSYPPPQALLIAGKKDPLTESQTSVSRTRPRSLFFLGKRYTESSSRPLRGQVITEKRPIGIYLQKAIAQNVDECDCSNYDVFEGHDDESLDASMSAQWDSKFQ